MSKVRFLDSHHHLWDLQAHAYPWLQNRRVEAHFGDYSAICKDYLVTDYQADGRDLELVSSVHVEAGISEQQKLAESVWLAAVSAEAGIPGALVAHADLASESLDADLEAQSDLAIVRGVRNMLFAPGTLNKSGDVSHCSLFDPAWRHGYARLASYNLSFDLQAPPPIMSEAARLLGEFPDTQVVLTHAGLPLDRSEQGIAFWRAGMRALAAQPHLSVKISGLPMTDWQWSEDSLRSWVLEVIDLFGPQRCMFGSNFPVDGLFSSLGDLIQAYWRITKGFSAEEREAMFVGNAARFYRIDIAG